MDFDIGNHSYRSTKLDAFRQFHVARKLAPVLGTLAPALSGLAEKGGGLEAILPMARAIADLPQADCDFILKSCLAVVGRQQGGAGYSPVFNAAADRMMFEDIEMPEMVQIAVNVIQDNLSRFTGALPSGLTVSVK